jgi:hypothetical protein
MTRHLWLIDDQEPPTALVSFFRRSSRAFRGNDVGWTHEDTLRAARFSVDKIVVFDTGDAQRTLDVLGHFCVNLGTLRAASRQIVVIAPTLGAETDARVAAALQQANFAVITGEQCSPAKELAHVGS